MNHPAKFMDQQTKQEYWVQHKAIFTQMNLQIANALKVGINSIHNICHTRWTY